MQSKTSSVIQRETIITTEIVSETEIYKQDNRDKPVLVRSQETQDSRLNNYSRGRGAEDSSKNITLSESRFNLESPKYSIEESFRTVTTETIETTIGITPDKGSSASPTIPAIDTLNIIRNSIEKSKAYPPLARRRGIEGKVFLRFRIRPDGKVDEIRIIKSSGFDILDKTAIETIKRSAPLPYVSGWIELPLVFRLSGY